MYQISITSEKFRGINHYDNCIPYYTILPRIIPRGVNYCLMKEGIIKKGKY